MGKKKRQGEPNMNTEDSESSEEYRNSPECPHIAKSVDLNKVKNVILKVSFQVECNECKKKPEESGTIENEYEYDATLWMCLKCGHQACGRMKNQHALKHYETPHSDKHSLCLNTTKWSVWCYDCDDEVNVTSKKKLLECVEYLKKQSESGKKKLATNEEANKYMSMDCVPILTKNQISPGIGLPNARGLVNLGNTCFFNSVMQCLGQTPYLLQLLEETANPGQSFRLPGGKLCLDEKKKEIIELDPLGGILEEWRPLTKYLAETLKELQSGRPEVYNPRTLFSRLTQRMPQFGGGHQHDSHELLRHLLEAVREEDLRRYQTVILENLGLSRKTDPASVEGDKKKIIRFYGSQASELLLPTEQVFRGVLVSTLQCQDCEHTSHRDEFFLDLSLPISEKQTPPILRRKADEMDDSKPSKHQLKKEKKQARKNKKGRTRNGNNGTILNNSTNTNDAQNENENNSESESDADVEDNIEDSSNNLHTPDEGPTKGTESGYNSDKNGSPDNISPDMCVDDSGIPSPAVGMLSISPLEPGSPENSPASSETNIDMGSPLGGHGTLNDDLSINEEFERPESRLSFVHNKGSDLKVDLEKLSIKNEKNIDLENVQDGAYGGYEEEDEKMDVDNEDLWGGTISARYNIEDGECSVQSCLNQFTTSELMTANNKVSCEQCTERHGGSDKKTIYTNARKQLLIYNPPAVLILHLKRFQVYHFRPTKLCKYVKFPTLLDIAPFCSKRSKSLPTFGAGQTEVLYSLYGVVEHSGSMYGGHYVAYVKVRPKLPEDSYRWQFLPKYQKKDASLQFKEGKPEDYQIPSGKWYYISDSYSSEVPESKVLNANAYVLFYERIM